MDAEMKVLFMDDDRNRQAKRFLQKEGDDLRQVWNAADCIELLKSEKFDRCEFDHDLEGQFQSPEEENTGSGVVRWILANRPEIGEIVVHSYNKFAALKMTQDLLDAGYKCKYIPFNF